MVQILAGLFGWWINQPIIIFLSFTSIDDWCFNIFIQQHNDKGKKKLAFYFPLEERPNSKRYSFNTLVSATWTMSAILEAAAILKLIESFFKVRPTRRFSFTWGVFIAVHTWGLRCNSRYYPDFPPKLAAFL